MAIDFYAQMEINAEMELEDIINRKYEQIKTDWYQSWEEDELNFKKTTALWQAAKDYNPEFKPEKEYQAEDYDGILELMAFGSEHVRRAKMKSREWQYWKKEFKELKQRLGDWTQKLTFDIIFARGSVLRFARPSWNKMKIKNWNEVCGYFFAEASKAERVQSQFMPLLITSFAIIFLIAWIYAVKQMAPAG